MTPPAERDTLRFRLTEVAEALVRLHDLHEGRWMLGVNFQFAAITIGSTPEDARPTAMSQIEGLQLVRQPEDAPASPLIVDAAQVNPRPKRRSPRAARPA
jgi:hypothetical protein